MPLLLDLPDQTLVDPKPHSFATRTPCTWGHSTTGRGRDCQSLDSDVLANKESASVESRCDAVVEVQPIRCRPFRLSVPHELDHASVFTPRSSNRMCGFPASGSRRKCHDVARGKLRVRLVRQTRPSTSCSDVSGDLLIPGHTPLCLARNH
jgi:hypothetical protein